ncbi:MAG: ferredoxin-like protein [Dehalogenimonas sp.]|uniref:Ferredoxin-like protein n=1 Tax=Candidatus Dehalogenimonas loeffleri TaxID=3127115 RepID=A0ABZ2J334_9CHLR|nr:ferredoxin-like protein [Dehalogenimonas sp.]
MLLAPLVRIPLLGRLVRRAANRYAAQHHGAFALTAAEAEEIVTRSAWVAVGECACRRTFHNCDAPVEAELIVGFGRNVYAEVSEKTRRITSAEAVALLQQCRESRLMPLMMQCRGHYYAICNCCQCCCVPHRLKTRFGINYAIVRRPEIVEDFFAQLADHHG